MNRFFYILLLLLWLVGCNSHEEITSDLPVITFEQGESYEIKVDTSLTLSPSVEYGQRYKWMADGVTLATTPTYTFTSEREGTFYITLRVDNEAGYSQADVRIDVVALQPPIISFAVGADKILTLPFGEHTLSAEVLGGEDATFEWRKDGEIVSRDRSCPLTLTEEGEHRLSLRVENTDGVAEEQLTLRVVRRLEGEIFMADSYTVPLSRTLYVDATLWNFSQPTYLWQCEGVTSTDEVFSFTPTTEGEYTLSLTVSDSDGYSLSRTISVVCTPAEGTFRHAITEQSIATASKVYAYRPAAGQFINEPQSGFAGEATAEAATAYAERRLAEGKYLSLGAWGGYVVVGFDHSVANVDGERDFSIAGNMYEGSSEAGIVWVMQDENGNGLPDDVWYELRGSEWGTPNHSRGYAITYYRPSAEGMNVQWHDNRGQSGTMKRNATHTHGYYYPAWEQDTFTLYGSWLAPNTEVDASTGNQVNRAYAWGYADNEGSDSDSGATGEAVKTYFDIESAVAPNGEAVALQYIDFVKIQSAINHSAGVLGEISTEVLSVKDENL